VGKVKTLLVITYLLGGQTIDTDIFENISMAECLDSKKAALEGVNPVTTKHPSHVEIVAECKNDERSASLNNHPSAM
jgi:hypothetical protein